MTAPLLPTFFVIGVPKSGSTSLYQYLDQHPGVYFSRLKEPRYFAFDGDLPTDLQGVHWLADTWERYVELFAGADPEQVRGEASVNYLYSRGAEDRIRDRVPDARLVVILRHPADAVWSHYLMLRRGGNTTKRLEELIEEEPLEPIAPPWKREPNAVVRSRLYHRHLSRWLEVFPREQLLVLLHDDLLGDPEAVVRQTWAHVGVDPSAPLDVVERHNVGTDPRSVRLHAFTERPRRLSRAVKVTLRHVPGRPALQAAVNRWNQRPTPPMPVGARAQLLDLYREDTLALEGMLDRDLSAWRR